MNRLGRWLSDDDWAKEYEAFMGGPSVPPPLSLSERLFHRVRTQLVPSVPRVFAKLCLTTIVGGIISLAVCPQFGLGFVPHASHVTHFFRGLGEIGCAIACGALFLSISAGLAAVILGTAELRLIRRTKLLQIPCVALLVLSAFVCAGAEVLLTYAVLWWLGAVVAGVSTIEAVFAVRMYVRGRA